MDVVISVNEVRVEVTDVDDTTIEGPLVMTTHQSARLEFKHGIVGMHERVAAFGGTLVAERTPDHGFRVTALIPLRVGP